jgi:hypothetical protein
MAPPPQLSLHIGELRFQSIRTEHGPYIAKRTQKAVYIVSCLWHLPIVFRKVFITTQINVIVGGIIAKLSVVATLSGSKTKLLKINIFILPYFIMVLHFWCNF